MGHAAKLIDAYHLNPEEFKEDDERPDNDEIDGIALDAEGNTTIGGVFRNALAPLGLTSNSDETIFLASYDPAGAVRFARSLGRGNIFDMASDGTNTYASGWFAGTVNFGDGYVLTAQGGHDMFVAKFGPLGATVWARRFGGTSEDGGNEIAVSAAGVAVAAISGGAFQGQPFVGPGADGYAMLLDPDDGGIVRTTKFSGLGSGCRIRGIAINDSGEMAVGFMFRGTMKWPGGQVTSAGGTDGATAKIDNFGDVEWVYRDGGWNGDFVCGVAITPGGDVYSGGRKAGDDFLVRRTTYGAESWRIIVAAGASKGLEIKLDANGILASGGMLGNAVIKRGAVTIGNLTSPNPTAYLMAISPSGGLRWAYMPVPVGSGSGAYGDAIAVWGSHAAQVARFTGTLTAAGSSMTSAGDDSATIRFAID